MGASREAKGWIARRTATLLFCLLLLPLALSSTLPSFARLVAGRAPHVCHCAVSEGHDTCACPICHPDRDDLDGSDESIRGQCGDQDIAYGARFGVGVGSASSLVLPPALTVITVPDANVSSPPDRSQSPPRRPPKV